MKRLAFTTLAGLACALTVTPPAHAAPPNDAQVAGGCVAYDVRDEVHLAPPNSGAVLLSAAAVAYSPTPGHNPVTLTSLTCTLVLGASTGPTYFATTAGPVGVLSPQVVLHSLGDAQNVQVCTAWTTVDAHFQSKSGGGCTPVNSQGVPPHVILDSVEGAVCLALSAAAPIQVGSLLYVAPGGDVYVNGSRVHNCYPY